MNANNIPVLPAKSARKPVAEEKSNPSVILLTPKRNDADAVRKILGDSCELTACSSSMDFTDLIRRSREKAPELILVRDSLIEKDPTFLKGIKEDMRGYTPLLLLKSKADKNYSSKYVNTWIRDIVSLDEAERTRFVVRRELQDFRVRCACKRHAARAAKYKRQLRRLIKPTKDVESSCTDTAIEVSDRTRFLEEFSRRLKVHPARGVRVLAWIRLDQFRTVEDVLGIVASEGALAHTAGVLRKLQHPEDLVGRIGGTVFAILLERGTLEEVEAWVQQFYRSLNERPFVTNGNSARLSCTTGLSEIANGTNSMEQVLTEAHNACRCGRMQGERQIFLSAGSISARSSRLQDKNWAKRIKLALRENRFQLIRSPIVRLDGQNDKVRDTWVRMIDEKGNTILPGEFMPVAKRLGLMTLIDRWVIAATLTYCIKRKPNLVFVRLSKSTILDSSLRHWLERVFRDSAVKPSQMCFQITEAVAGRNLTHVVRQANDLREFGFNIAIAGIGADKNMKEVLHLVPMQYARIDSTLLQRVARDKSVRHQVSKIVNAIKERGILAIADHVEDAATMATLCQMDVEFMQGDYLRRDNIVLEDTMTVCTPALPAAEGL